jgi:hypothetical protein
VRTNDLPSRYLGNAVITMTPADPAAESRRQGRKAALKREWARHGGSLTDPELTRLAIAISSGTQSRVA